MANQSAPPHQDSIFLRGIFSLYYCALVCLASQWEQSNQSTLSQLDWPYFDQSDNSAQLKWSCPIVILLLAEPIQPIKHLTNFNRIAFSVTRFGKILPLWKIWVIFWGLFSNWQIFKPTFIIFNAFGLFFLVLNCHILNK